MMQKENINLKYWNFFYEKKNSLSEPSKFAIFCQKKLKNYKGVIYDLGCGDGRDTIYFNKKKIYCNGIDRSNKAILKNRGKFPFFKQRFTNKNFCSYFSKNIKKNFSVYSRFSLHSINKKSETSLFKYLNKQKKLEYLFIETRTLNDELYGVGKRVGKHEFISTHYRRFIDPSLLKKQIKKNFQIIYFKSQKGFAKFKKEDPCVLRIIAKKKLI